MSSIDIEVENKPLVVKLGDGTEPNLDSYYEGYIPEIGWYFLLSPMLSPYGPYGSEEEAKTAATEYLASK